ncbi:Glutathione S-transferase-O-methyltransferase fusion protein 5 [Zostera marina]|uniref:Glutathione S-transferase-O-methyltransferase fusion protein 5 n=1 Tax=Zostera marina TaxID=29655 RepID=A0A0K9PR50_ZOSMR|nr:Glutathione S-transferase-O-methyltransferase fusion protein 5 [Zostera marina]
MMKVTELGVKVIGRQSSPFVIRIKIALNIKGILYEFVDEDIIGNQGGILSDVVFIHAGNEITEPYEIVQYIDETWKTVDTPSILPTDMYDSIVQTFWVKFIDNKIELAMKEILTKSMDVQEFDKIMEILECAFQRCSQGKNFFGGQNMNYIDICFGSMLGFILSAENKLTDIKLLDVKKTPLLFKWAEHFRAQDLIKGIIITDVDNIVKMEENESYVNALKLVHCSVLPNMMKFSIELGIVDVLVNAGSGKFLSTKEIADKLIIGNPDAPVLFDRVLRCLSSHGIFKYKLQKSDDGSTISRLYGASPMCFNFVKDEHGVCLAPLFLLNQEKVMMECWNYLKDTVKNGGTPFNKAHGMSIFEYASKDLVFNKTFNICMYSHSMITMKKILNSYTGFNDLKTLVDVGGGVGVTLKTIISKYPNINGINFDLPHVIANAPTIQGVNHVIGNMFENIPSGDAILLKWILHDWSDEQCVLLLKKCWETLGEKGKVIVIEGIVPISPNARNPIFESDVNMLTYCKGGKERTEMEFSSLAKKAGFSCFKISLTISNYISVMEFIK